MANMLNWLKENSEFKHNVLRLATAMLLVVLISSCSPSRADEINRSVSVFFLGLFQILNLVLLGVPSLVFSIISASSPKPVFRILGIVFLSIFTLLALLGFIAVVNVPPRHFDVYFIFLIELALLAGSIVSIVIGARKKQTGNIYDSNSAQDLLDI